MKPGQFGQSRGVTPDLAQFPNVAASARVERFVFHDELRLGGKVITFPQVHTGRKLQPTAWFEETIGDGQLHEPRAVDWLMWLSGELAGRKVRFYDIGALFGYFTAIAGALFAGAEIVAVEPEAEAAEFIRKTVRANRLDGAQVQEVMLDTARGSHRFAQSGHRFTRSETGTEFRTCTLGDILLPERKDTAEILKIDTEGHQAAFLPGASGALIRRQAVLLLEFDRPDKLARYHTTNADLVEPFLAQGYRLYWCDHRIPGAPIERLDRVGPQHECNSMAVLLPSLGVEAS